MRTGILKRDPRMSRDVVKAEAEKLFPWVKIVARGSIPGKWHIFENKYDYAKWKKEVK